MQLSQIRTQDGAVQVVARDGTEAYVIRNCPSTYDLALDCANRGVLLKERIGELGLGAAVDVEGALAQGRVLAPIHHPDPAQMFLSGVDLRGIAQKGQFGRTRPLRLDWIYKGDGNAVGAPGMDLMMRSTASDDGKGPAIAGVYIINKDGAPFRIGFAMASDFSDHVMTTQAGVGFAQDRLRPVSFGPELLLGALPQDFQGMARLNRDDVAVFEIPFTSNQDDMIDAIADLEHHHFRSDILRQPGHLHIHIFAMAYGTLGENGVPMAEGWAEVASPQFGLPLRNNLRIAQSAPDAPVQMRVL